MMLASAVLHAAVVAALYGAGILAEHMVPKPQVVMTARLVRLGPARDKKLLPTLAPAAKAPPVRKPNPVPTSPKAVPKPTAQEQATPPAAQKQASPSPSPAVSARTQSTLERLRAIAAGAADGDVAGEADDPLAGDRYTAEVERCMHAHYDILGVDDARKAQRVVRVLVRIGPSGKVTSYRLVQKSGIAAFDDAVERAVRLCPELPAPPLERREQLRRGGIEITFNP